MLKQLTLYKENQQDDIIIPVEDISTIDIFTRGRPAKIWHQWWDLIDKKPGRCLFGINYGTLKTPGMRFRRGFIFGGSIYEIDVENKKLIEHNPRTARESFHNLHNDLFFHASCTDNNYVLEGDIWDFFGELSKQGYREQ
ncbi:MAG: hypothetical protein ACE5ES_02015 [Candidatus Nanoarchaeia archaeon]